MDTLTNPVTPDRALQGLRSLAALDAAACSTERLLAWNDVVEPDPDGSCVVYWMARSQRGEHNLALDCAIAAARAANLPLVVAFRLATGPEGTRLRHVEWMLRGMSDAFDACRRRGAHVLLIKHGGPALQELLGPDQLRPSIVVADDDCMPRARRGRARVAASLGVPFVTVDADVVVPGACLPKQEYAARTIRPKVHRLLEQHAAELGEPGGGSAAPTLHRPECSLPAGATWIEGELGLEHLLADARQLGLPDDAALLVDEPSGTAAARARLGVFLATVLPGYAEQRNRPELDATSRLSPFVHFGQISPIEVLSAVRTSGAPEPDVATFVEEFVVRRELAHNYVRWNPRAHLLAGAPDWAQRTLAEHAGDAREWLWDDDVLAAGDTHDPLWNAAQRQLVERGHMHGYVRMYWAKKLLEWRADPAEAFDLALRMNDRWQLDGRDPAGIVGVAWAIGGVHDRPWTERPIFGKIRYMSLGSTGRKFDSRAYVARWGGVSGAAAKDPGWYASAVRPASLLD